MDSTIWTSALHFVLRADVMAQGCGMHGWGDFVSNIQTL